MAESNPGEPLAATVGEQLREKAELEQRSDEERRASDRQHEQVERKKADEREAVLRHTGGEKRLRPRRTARGPGESRTRLPSWAVPAAIVAGMWFTRRSRLVLVAGVAVGAALIAARAQERIEAY